MLQTVLLFSLGGTEAFIIIFAMLLLFGAKKIPELARGLGKGIREFKDASNGIRNELEEGIKNAGETNNKAKSE